MTPQEELLEQVTKCAKAYHYHNTQSDKITEDCNERRDKLIRPHITARNKAAEDADRLLADENMVKAFTTFKPGDFIKRESDEFYEVVGSVLRYHTNGEGDTMTVEITVNLRCLEIKWDGTIKNRYTTTVSQDRAVRVSETDDKRLMKRVKKRVIERLEGTGVTPV